MNFNKNRVIAAVRTKDDLNEAVTSPVDNIFLLSSNILTLGEMVDFAHVRGKKIFIHLDLAEGVGKDKSGVLFIANTGADGIISTRVNIIKAAKDCGLEAVQRFFIVDSHSMSTAIESLTAAKPDNIEIMPGVLPKIIRHFKKRVSMPIIAGGLIETEAEAASLINAGAAAVSTAKKRLWTREGVV